MLHLRVRLLPRLQDGEGGQRAPGHKGKGGKQTRTDCLQRGFGAFSRFFFLFNAKCLVSVLFLFQQNVTQFTFPDLENSFLAAVENKTKILKYFRRRWSGSSPWRTKPFPLTTRRSCSGPRSPVTWTRLGLAWGGRGRTRTSWGWRWPWRRWAPQ